MGCCPKCQATLPSNAPQGLCAKCLLAAASKLTEIGPSQTATSGAVPPPLETVSAAFPQLEILGLIGHGGMGVVYKARQPKLDRLVALKLLTQSLARDPAFAERFNREARFLARLNHPSIVNVYDYGEAGGFYYLLMEYVDGVNLRQAMQAGRFTPAQALALVPKICDALQFAHNEGVLHRDVKPENILLDLRGRVKMADFGIAKLVGDCVPEATLTASGQTVGTPHYMAPEQWEHPQEVDQRADIYSLGVVFYEMLTGELPVGRFAPPSEKTPVDPRVDAVVFRALEKEREKRFDSAAEVKSRVEAITATPGAAASVPRPDATGSAPHTPANSLPDRCMHCFVSTPEHLRSFTGQVLNPFTGQGELRLTSDQLSFVSHWQAITIPLPEIEALATGHFPPWVMPVRLHYISVTFTQGGQHRQLFFTPTPSRSCSAWETNQQVADCWHALQEAIRRRTGKLPP